MFGVFLIFLILTFRAVGVYSGGIAMAFPLVILMGKEVELVFLLDVVAVLFSWRVALIAGSIFFYIKFYMGRENLIRFNWLVFLFVVSIFLLIYRGNFIIMLVGWDGLGIVSFLLVVYYNNEFRIRSGVLTILINRLGDAFIILAVCLLWGERFNTFYILWVDEDYFLVMAIMVGGMTKRAQFPFSRWLPAAITAPTPVSSLVHSSTLVTAGIFVYIRLFEMIYLTWLGQLLLCIGLITIILGGLIALAESDLKKIVAYSTLSQLGIMVFILSAGEIEICFLHLLSHAIFKSLLFIVCGCHIASVFGNQDGRLFGLDGRIERIKIFIISIACLSLMGFPLTGGFISKDAGLEILIGSNFSFMLELRFYVGCVLTVGYRLKIFIGGMCSSKFGFSISNNEETKVWFTPMFCLLLFNFFCIIVFEEILLGNFITTGFQDMKVLDIVIISMGLLLWFVLLGGKYNISYPMITDFFHLGWGIFFFRGKLIKVGATISNAIERGVDRLQAKAIQRIVGMNLMDHLVKSTEAKKVFVLLVFIFFICFHIFKLSSLNDLLTTNRF